MLQSCVPVRGLVGGPGRVETDEPAVRPHQPRPRPAYRPLHQGEQPTPPAPHFVGKRQKQKVLLDQPHSPDDEPDDHVAGSDLQPGHLVPLPGGQVRLVPHYPPSICFKLN